MAGNWTKLTTTGNVRDLDDIVAVMSMLDSGLMIEDYSDFSLDGMYGALVDEAILEANRDIVRVSFFIPEEKNPAEYKEYMTVRFAALGIECEISTEGMNEEDWSESWKQYYKPVKIGRVVVVPAWEKYEPTDGETIITMDPGMAFGTGTHETTRLVMRIMQDELTGGERLLDIGTGSGILSILASKLGAKECFAYDIDPVAVKVAKENVERENMTNITVGTSDLLLGIDKSAKYDFVVANIVADIIIRMLPDLEKYTISGAPIILSGIIADSRDRVAECAKDLGYNIVREEKENDWVGMLIKK